MRQSETERDREREREDGGREVEVTYPVHTDSGAKGFQET